jgi:uncharacterized protein (TIGR02145 family)
LFARFRFKHNGIIISCSHITFIKKGGGMRLRAWLVQGRGLLLASVIVGVACVSCSADTPAALVGNWVHCDGVTWNKPESIELFKDGTGVVDKGTSVTWKIENKRFVLLSPLMALSCDYKISGSELTLAYDGDGSAVFVRKEKLAEYTKKKEDEKRLADDRKRKETEAEGKETEAKIEKMSSYFTDSRNGQKYRAVKVGGKTWMAQNLNYKTGNSWCYGNEDSKCNQYGRLYDWNTAKAACPSGWHLPSRVEWKDLETAAGGDVAGKNLKAASGWSGNGNGTNEYGFSALPGGARVVDGGFLLAGSNGLWWTASAGLIGKTSMRGMYSRFDFVDTWDVDGDLGYSVRCVGD